MGKGLAYYYVQGLFFFYVKEIGICLVRACFVSRYGKGGYLLFYLLFGCLYVLVYFSVWYVEQFFEINGKVVFVNIGFYCFCIVLLFFKIGIFGQLLKEDLIFGCGLYVGFGKGKCFKNCYINVYFQFLCLGWLQGVVGNGLLVQVVVDQFVGFILLLIGGVYVSCIYCCLEFQFLEDFQVDVFVYMVGGIDVVKGGLVYIFIKQC